MTTQEAKNLKPGSWIRSKVDQTSRGEAKRARVTSVKTWKTRPDQVLVTWQHGLYQYGRLTENTVEQWEVVEI